MEGRSKLLAPEAEPLRATFHDLRVLHFAEVLFWTKVGHTSASPVRNALFKELS